MPKSPFLEYPLPTELLKLLSDSLKKEMHLELLNIISLNFNMSSFVPKKFEGKTRTLIFSNFLIILHLSL